MRTAFLFLSGGEGLRCKEGVLAMAVLVPPLKSHSGGSGWENKEEKALDPKGASADA